MTLFEALNLRFEYEELVRKLRLPRERKAGTLDTMIWLSNPKNRWNISKDPNASRILEISKAIVDEENTRTKFV